MEKEYFPFSPEGLALATLDISEGVSDHESIKVQVKEHWGQLLCFLTLPDGDIDWGAVRNYFWNHVPKAIMTNADFRHETESILIDLCGFEEAHKGSETIFYPWCEGF